MEKNLVVNMENAEKMLNALNKKYFLEELKEGRLGTRIKKALI